MIAKVLQTGSHHVRFLLFEDFYSTPAGMIFGAFRKEYRRGKYGFCFRRELKWFLVLTYHDAFFIINGKDL